MLSLGKCRDKKELQVEELESFNQSKLLIESEKIRLEDINANIPQRNQNRIREAKSKNTEALYKLYID